MRRRERALLAGLCLLAAAAPATTGCGRIGPPRPPEYVIPTAPDPVAAESAPEGVKVSWRRPRDYVDGQPLDDLAGFRVLRACQPEPVFAAVTTVPVTDQQRFRKASSFAIVDQDAPLGIACRYQVIAFTFDDYSSPPAESEDVVRTVPGALR